MVARWIVLPVVAGMVASCAGASHGDEGGGDGGQEQGAAQGAGDAGADAVRDRGPGGDGEHEHDDADGGRVDHAASTDGPTALERLLANNAIRDEAGWMRVGLTHSDVTGGLRRVFVDKYAVVQALLAWAATDDDGAPAPLAYAPGAMFVAENLDAPGGEVASTFVIRFDDDGAPTFTAYDRAGARAESFEYLVDGEPAVGAVPDDCRACHVGERVFPPLAAYPDEPARLAVDVDPRHRDVERVTRFGEAYTRGSGVFGPYQPVAKVIPRGTAPFTPGASFPDLDEATDSPAIQGLAHDAIDTVPHESTSTTGCYGGMLVAALAADRRDGRLAKYDETSLMYRAQRYADLLGMADMFGDDEGGDAR